MLRIIRGDTSEQTSGCTCFGQFCHTYLHLVLVSTERTHPSDPLNASEYTLALIACHRILSQIVTAEPDKECYRFLASQDMDQAGSVAR